MAGFCLDCWNKMNQTDDNKEKYIISEDLDLCEGCGKWKHVIIMERKAYYMYKFGYFIVLFRIIFYVLYLIWKLLTLPYLLFRFYKSKKNDTL